MFEELQIHFTQIFKELQIHFAKIFEVIQIHLTKIFEEFQIHFTKMLHLRSDMSAATNLVLSVSAIFYIFHWDKFILKF